jgi:glutamate N-acetyltransferase / amino-acid N-acetyltransferase
MIPRVPLPRGFRASGINSGVRRYRPDLGIIVSDRDCAASAVFTRGTLKAAPVQYSAKLVPSEKIRAIVVNSGQANAATGEEGLQDNLALVTRVAENLSLDASQVLVASTGVIGVRLPLDILLPAIPSAIRAHNEVINNFALAIMTTDLVPKFGHREVELSGGKVTITGAAKGSGMIHPNMGTMLGFILTDLAVDSKWLDTTFKSINDETFNMISVDGETSTNDCVFLLANGASDVALKTADDKKKFIDALREVATQLAISIARDGEGASKLITVQVNNAPNMVQAREAARMITTSPLIKSAMHGEDPNWGRILARLGMAGIDSSSFALLNVDLQGVRVFGRGKPLPFDRKEAREKLHDEHISILVDLNNGTHSATAWGCDLTKRYVEINTEYS